MPDAHPAAAAFARIVAWLDRHAPPVAAGLRGPATDADLDGLERELKAADPPFPGEVPAALRAVLKVRNGGRDAAVLPGGPVFDECPFDLLSASNIFEERAAWTRNQRESPLSADDLAYADDVSDPRVRRAGFLPAWLPFAEVGGNLLCLDDDPAPGGTPGQVIALNHEDAGTHHLADSLTGYLEAAADAFEAGRYELEEDYLVVAGG